MKKETNQCNPPRPTQNIANPGEWPQQDTNWLQQPTERCMAGQRAQHLSEITHPEELDEMLKALRLPTFRRHLQTLIEAAEAHQYSYRSFLAMLCAEEVAARKQKRIERDVKRASLPEIITVDDLDFTYQTSIRRRQLGSYLDASLVTEGRCAIFLDLLISTLARAAKADSLDAALVQYTEPDVLAIDEIS